MVVHKSTRRCCKNNLLFKREERRDRHGHDRVPYHENHGKPFYCPLEYLDKRFVAEMYKQFDLMNNLFPITKLSCVEYAEKTDYFSKPCKECWWCREKKWATECMTALNDIRI